MKPVIRRPRSTLRILAAALVAASQFAVSSFAPLADSNAGNSAPSHVEAFGVSLHFSHNPDDCAACVAQTLVGITSSGSSLLDAPEAPASTRNAIASIVVARFDWSPGAPRAPPVRSRASLSS